MRILPVLMLLVLAACDPIRNTPDPRTGPDACGASAFQPLTNRPFHPSMTSDQPGPVRVIRLDQAVTMDYLPHRLNITLDSKDRVTGAYCG